MRKYHIKLLYFNCVWQTHTTQREIKKNKKAQLSLINPRDAKACQNCSNSTCLQRCRWQYRSIFIRLAVVAAEICEIIEILWKFKLIEFKVIQGHRSWCQSKAHTYTFPLATNRNFGRISLTVFQILMHLARK